MNSSSVSPSSGPDYDNEAYRRAVGGYQYDVYVPMLWCLLFLCVFTLSTTYSFAQQRKFPACVASWSVMLSAVKCIREIFKWGNYSQIHNYLVWHPTQKICASGFAADVFFDSGFSINNLILTVIIYLSVKKGIDMTRPTATNWYRVALIVFWVYTASWTIAAANLRDFVPAPPICPSKIDGPRFNFLFLCIYFLFIVVEIVLLVSSSKYIHSVFKRAKGIMIGPSASRSSDMRLVVTTSRFLLIIVMQTVPGVLFEVYHLLAVFAAKNPVDLIPVGKAYLTWVFIAGTSECFIIIAFNRDLMRWIKYRYLRFRGAETERSSGSEERNKEEADQDDNNNNNNNVEEGFVTVELTSSPPISSV
eukprot:TRINITY_DN6242_c0_g1_i1.p1 TRINITY_DN6242_c0_g1~~TRINITY_DN6242_c0_g1_i1.p1  ORF type:complete len:362 (-),score=33.46 TRINITY_DN6242_c0_g1_i1:73-1158(-)